MSKITKVPFFRPSVGEDEIMAVSECLRSGWLTTGPKTAEFEAAFAAEFDSNISCLAVTSATAAMHLGLEALGIGPGDEVIVPTLTFTATAEVVRYLGADVVLVDTDPDSLCLSIDEVEAAITPKTRAIMPVHFAGRPCDMTRLRRLADSHGDIKIMADAAHAFPASHNGRLIGECGAHATAFSFYANKTMTTGEGGMLVTNDADIAARARTMRLHGIDRDVFKRFTDTRASWLYDVVAPGFKYNMPDMAAALGTAQLARIHDFHATRTARAQRYDEALANMPLILPPHAAQGDVHSWHLYIVQLTEEAPLDRDEFITNLQAADIGCSVHYRPLHQMTVWSQNNAYHLFPAANRYFKRCVSLPLFMAMTDAEQERVIEVVTEILG